MSALLTATMRLTEEVTAPHESSGLRDKLTIVVGGAPVTQEYADKIGADGHAADAATAVRLARTLV